MHYEVWEIMRYDLQTNMVFSKSYDFREIMP